MKVARSCYYGYANRHTYRESDAAERVKECFESYRRRYGSRRIAASLKIGRSRVRKIMRRENLRAIAPKRSEPQTTESKHGLPICANLLQNGANAPTGKGEVLVGDITYPPPLKRFEMRP